ncbi:MAG: hypothetical protein HC930_01290 [Hydrococcus sp. SU_1_0]|nr:hypothetical protein [Hydrococcus sp. SU_1_0]
MTKNARVQGEINRRKIINYFENNSDWISLIHLVQIIGMSYAVVRGHCDTLALRGF